MNKKSIILIIICIVVIVAILGISKIRKNKTRLKRREAKENIINFVDFEITEEEQKEELIVKRKEIDLKPMSEEEAILQMNMLGHEFFAFQNSDTDSNSVLYRRKFYLQT